MKVLTNDLAKFIAVLLGGVDLARAAQVLIAVPLQLEEVVKAVLEAWKVNLLAISRSGFERLHIQSLELGLAQLFLVVHLVIPLGILQNFEVVEKLQEFGHVHEFLLLADLVERRLLPQHHLLRTVEAVNVLEEFHAFLGELAFKSDEPGISKQGHRSTEP